MGSLQKIANSVSQNSNVLVELDSWFCDNGENTESLLGRSKKLLSLTTEWYRKMAACTETGQLL